MHLKRILAFLSSSWGVLTSVTLLFPGAAALLNLPIIGDSPLKGDYAAIATVFSFLALVWLILWGAPRLQGRRVAAYVALAFGAVALVLLGAFFVAKTRFLNDAQWVETSWDPIVRHTRVKGVLKTEVISREGSVCLKRTAEGCLAEQSERPDPAELVALALFVGAFISLTLAFAPAGIHFYLHSSSSDGPSPP